MKITLNEDVLVDNNTAAAYLREQFIESKTLVINVMSSPGAGKTTLLEQTIAKLSNDFRIGVIEGDLATEIDADRIRAAGAQAVQINTKGGCHLDARMVAKTIPDFDLSEIDILFIENVGNLVCPSGYDLGQQHKISVLSVPEGNDKIPKYPVMFRRTELVLLNKIDLLPYLNFNVEVAEEDLMGINPDSKLLKLSATTGEGMDEWFNWIKEAYGKL
ncbi:hydrogenase nickel incorporation protein HypB [Anaerobacillus isosaccharinicus]|uniref:Hydrogenase accessory protein HypB n=1 Tax=Anaerobacillus isosaccharinicus TaxID=1532552 RepID=A0A1S2LDT3_9BACI|nr:hydrogenase nickel incorporation protein HypB [Anaerobacillus isosaccharinicus]MBA5585953.1 hydrogenase nickel incorporation protein HypB [Anaerobacillus isosaccharinicus]QOY35764.1 hydrogenase nickel incorporation protein HypB [Anaerobacillus isosaccharinicus]